MNKLMGVGLTAVVAMVLSACGMETNNQEARIPAAALAPVTEVTGVIPEEANQYGVIGLGWGVVEGADGYQVFFSEPYFPMEFDETGAFTLALPSDMGPVMDPAAPCPYHTASAILGGLYSLSEPLTGDKIALGTARTTYRLEAGDVIGLYWYSPVAERVKCTRTGPSTLTGQDESWDLRLATGWNMVLAHTSGDTAIMRTGILPELDWRPMPR